MGKGDHYKLPSLLQKLKRKKMKRLLLISIVVFASYAANSQVLQQKASYDYVFANDTIKDSAEKTFIAPPVIVAPYNYEWIVKLTVLSGSGSSTISLYDGIGSLYGLKTSFSLDSGRVDTVLTGEVFGTKQKLVIDANDTVKIKAQVGVVYKKK